MRIIILLLVSISAFSQGLCDLTPANGIELGDFDMPSAVCIGEPVKVKDRSGGTNIKYIFGYSGQPASGLVPTRTTPDAEWPFIGAGNRIVLQYGTKNGKDMYRCKVVTVRDKTEPLASVLPCNNNTIEISISNEPANNFDYYTIDWGDGNPQERVNPNQLPFKKIKSLSMPRTVTVNGAFNTASTCQASTAKVIPYLDNTVSGFNGYDMPNYPNIKAVELEKADRAVLTVSGSFDPSGYNLYMTPKGTPYSSTPFKTGVLPGDISVPISDTTQAYCFYIERPNACGTEMSAEICTMVLTDVNPLSSNSQEIIWEEYPSDMSHVSTDRTFGRYMDKTTQLLKEEDGVSLPPISVSGSPYQDNVNCQKEYCYRVKTETKGKIYYYGFEGVSISKRMCMDREDFHPPALTDALVIVNGANASEINYTDNSTWTLRRDKYMLYHDNGTAFNEIKSSPTLAPFVDASVDNSQKSNCYKIAFLDECGSTSELSPAFCTTFLSEGSGNKLIWTNNPPFADTGISTFEVQSYDETTGAISTVISLPATQLNYTPDLSGFEEEAKFRIRIVAPDLSESFSNTYTIPLAVKLLLPDAFTPNNDAVNDNLEIKGTFRRIANFDFQIYNKWGNPIFSSTDPLKSWDGNFQGFSAPVDTYTYKIYAKLTNGTEINKAGKFLLIR